MRIMLVSAQEEFREELAAAITERLPEAGIHHISTIAAMYSTLNKEPAVVVLDPTAPLRSESPANNDLQVPIVLVNKIRRRHPRARIIVMGTGALANGLLEYVSLVANYENVPHVATWIAESAQDD